MQAFIQDKKKLSNNPTKTKAFLPIKGEDFVSSELNYYRKKKNHFEAKMYDIKSICLAMLNVNQHPRHIVKIYMNLNMHLNLVILG